MKEALRLFARYTHHLLLYVLCFSFRRTWNMPVHHWVTRHLCKYSIPPLCTVLQY